MKSEDDIRRALETIRPSKKLIQKTLQRARTETATARRKPWPLAVNGVLAILVLAITLWTLGDAGLFTRGGTTTVGPLPSRDVKDPGIAILPAGVLDLSQTILSTDGRMAVYCVKNKYSVAMSDIIGLNIQPYLLQNVPATGMLVYEVTAGSGTLIDDRAFLPRQQVTVTTSAAPVYTAPVKTVPANVVTAPNVSIAPTSASGAATPLATTIPAAGATSVSPANPTGPLSEYAFPITGYVRINGNPELIKTIRLFWSPLVRDTIPEPGIDATVTINAYLESGTEKTPVSTMTLSVKYNPADRLYAFDPKPIG